MALRLHPWRFELEFVSKLVTLWLLAILQRPPRVTWCAYVHMIVSVMATHLV